MNSEWLRGGKKPDTLTVARTVWYVDDDERGHAETLEWTPEHVPYHPDAD